MKALAAFQLVYVLSSTASYSKSVKETNNLGGQKMLDIIEFNKALKISWILKYISNDCIVNGSVFFLILIYLK